MKRESPTCEHGVTAFRFRCPQCIAAIHAERLEALKRIFPEAFQYRRVHRETET